MHVPPPRPPRPRPRAADSPPQLALRLLCADVPPRPARVSPADRVCRDMHVPSRVCQLFPVEQHLGHRPRARRWCRRVRDPARWRQRPVVGRSARRRTALHPRSQRGVLPDIRIRQRYSSTLSRRSYSQPFRSCQARRFRSSSNCPCSEIPPPTRQFSFRLPSLPCRSSNRGIQTILSRQLTSLLQMSPPPSPT
jgi:hypothetical protein